jgi:hypothetical protein
MNFSCYHDSTLMLEETKIEYVAMLFISGLLSLSRHLHICHSLHFLALAASIAA